MVRFRDVLRLQAAAEISTADRRDEVGRRVSEDHSDGFDLAQLRGAFPEERRDDFGTGLTGRDAREIFALLVARLSKYPPLFPRD